MGSRTRYTIGSGMQISMTSLMTPVMAVQLYTAFLLMHVPGIVSSYDLATGWQGNVAARNKLPCEPATTNMAAHTE